MRTKVEWPPPHGTEQIFEQVPGRTAGGTKLRLTQAFEAHIRQLKNYKLGPGFMEAFPQTKGVDLYAIPD